MQNTLRYCPQCNHDNRTTALHPFSPQEWHLKNCAQCQFVYLENPPEYVELEENFAWEKTFHAQENERKKRYFLTRLSHLTRFRLHMLPRQSMAQMVKKYAKFGKVLDVGCGNGSHALKLPQGYVPVGIEISKYLAGEANKNFAALGGHCVQQPAVEGLKSLPANSIEAVTLRSYLEHESQPMAVLTEIQRVLAPNGVVIIKVPNYGSVNRVFRGKKWCGFRFPDHVNYFTKKSLRTMLESASLCLEPTPFWYSLPTGDNMWFVARKNK